MLLIRRRERHSATPAPWLTTNLLLLILGGVRKGMLTQYERTGRELTCRPLPITQQMGPHSWDLPAQLLF